MKITAENLQTLSHQQLVDLHASVHEMAYRLAKLSPTVNDVHIPSAMSRQRPKVTRQSLRSTHRLVREEMLRRGIGHRDHYLVKIYSGLSDPSLPKNVRALPKHKQEIWVAAFNSALQQYKDEGRAFATAWAAVKKESNMGEELMQAAGDRDAAKQAQEARASKYGIGVKEGGNVTKPGEWSNVSDGDWLDAANYRYPIHDKEHLFAAMRYFNHEGMRERGQYSPEEWSKMGNKLADRLGAGYEYRAGKVVHTEEKRDVRPEVGGGTNVDELPASSFVFSDTRTFPIITAADVSDAVHSWGRYRGPHSFEEFKRRLTALARRKGLEAALPKEWTEKSWEVEITKLDEERQLTYGVVLKPAPFEDSQQDIIPPEHVEKAAHGFLEQYRLYDIHHQTDLEAKDAIPAESYIAPVDFEMGGKPVLKGSWVLVTHVVNKDVWEAIKKGEINAYSIRGLGVRQEVKE